MAGNTLRVYYGLPTDLSCMHAAARPCSHPAFGWGEVPQIDRFSDGKLIGSICCFSAFQLLSEDLTSCRDRLEADSEGSPGLQWDAAYVADLSNVTNSNTRPMASSTAGLGFPLPSTVSRPPHSPAPDMCEPHTFMRGAPPSSSPMLGSWESGHSNGPPGGGKLPQSGYSNTDLRTSTPGHTGCWSKRLSA